jgi:hypothetical protein
LKSYRSGILDFCGSEVSTQYDKNGQEGKLCFMNFENGVYSKNILFDGIKTKHPNILKGVIIGKKSWGLWRNEWSDGISEGSFTFKEIIEQFTENDINVPESLLKDLKNTINKKVIKLLNKNI